jgi:outer membrane receptor protein involved in Fe transport
VTAGLFHALSIDDIIVVADQISGRGYFSNAGDTLRQGIEAGVRYTDKRLMVYANYALVDATFQSAFIIASPNNPSSAGFNCDLGAPGPPANADDPICVQVDEGDRIPGIPLQRFKAGFDYWLTSKWKLGADLVGASSQIFFGDEGNDNPPLAGYGKVDLHSSYDVTEHVQLYGLVNNLFDARYGLFGNFSDPEAANSAAAADPSTGAGFFTNPRTFTPAAPFSLRREGAI